MNYKIGIESIVKFFYLSFCFSLNFEQIVIPIPISFTYSKLLFSIFCVFFVSFYGLNKSIFNQPSRLFVILFFVYTVVINLLNVNNISFNFISVPMFLNILMFLFLVNYELREPGILKKGLIVFSLGAVLTSIFYFLNIGTSVGDDFRVTIFDDNENMVGIRMVIGIAILLNYLLENIKVNLFNLVMKLAAVISIPLMTILLVDTGSRIGIISLILSSLLFVGFHRFTIIQRITALIVICLSGYYLFEYIQNSGVLIRRIELALEGNSAGRDELWAFAINIFKSNYIWGVGETGYNELCFTKFGQISSPHNVFIEVLVKNGIIGGSLFFLFLVNLVIKSFSNYYQRGQILPLVLLFVIILLMFTGQILNTKIAWFVFAFSFYFKNSLTKDIHTEPLYFLKNERHFYSN